MGIQQGDYYTEDTLFKVFKALRKIGLDEEQATAAISEMQNAGILFRERRPAESMMTQLHYRDTAEATNVNLSRGS